MYILTKVNDNTELEYQAANSDLDTLKESAQVLERMSTANDCSLNPQLYWYSDEFGNAYAVGIDGRYYIVPLTLYNKFGQALT